MCRHRWGSRSTSATAPASTSTALVRRPGRRPARSPPSAASAQPAVPECGAESQRNRRGREGRPRAGRPRAPRRAVDAEPSASTSWESCLTWLPVTESATIDQNLGYVRQPGTPATRRHDPAIDIDTGEWDDPDYQLVAFVGRDRPFGPDECETEPGEEDLRLRAAVGAAAAQPADAPSGSSASRRRWRTSASPSKRSRSSTNASIPSGRRVAPGTSTRVGVALGSALRAVVRPARPQAGAARLDGLPGRGATPRSSATRTCPVRERRNSVYLWLDSLSVAGNGSLSAHPRAHCGGGQPRDRRPPPNALATSLELADGNPYTVRA